MVNILGQSGKFTVYNEGKGQGSGIQVTMDALREVDSSGSTVGASGSVKHSINTFAAQNFAFTHDETVTIYGLAASKVSFQSQVSSIGFLTVDTYIFQEGGLVGPPGEQWSVGCGDLKWNINFSSWSWCGCSRGQSQETGAYIDLDVSVRGQASIQARAGNSRSLELGDGMTCELSSQVQVDGNWTQMPTGYPAISTQGSTTTFTFRFPRFASFALYDPLITGVSPPDTTTTAPAVPTTTAAEAPFMPVSGGTSAATTTVVVGAPTTTAAGSAGAATTTVVADAPTTIAAGGTSAATTTLVAGAPTTTVAGGTNPATTTVVAGAPTTTAASGAGAETTTMVVGAPTTTAAGGTSAATTTVAVGAPTTTAAGGTSAATTTVVAGAPTTTAAGDTSVAITTVAAGAPTTTAAGGTSAATTTVAASAPTTTVAGGTSAATTTVAAGAPTTTAAGGTSVATTTAAAGAPTTTAAGGTGAATTTVVAGAPTTTAAGGTSAATTTLVAGAPTTTDAGGALSTIAAGAAATTTAAGSNQMTTLASSVATTAEAGAAATTAAVATTTAAAGAAATTAMVAGGDETTTTADGAATTTVASASSPQCSSSRTMIDVLGQSGKFTVYDEAKGSGRGIQVTMDALREVDSSGSEVGASGSTKHSISTFAAQSFRFTHNETVTVYNLKASKVSFQSDVSGVGRLAVDTYVFLEGGLVGPPGEQWSVGCGDLKWNINFSSWSWCGCTKGKAQETGAYIDLDVSVRGQAAIQAKAGSSRSLELGDGMKCELSSQVQVDDLWTQMPAGYPRISTKGSTTTFTFRFPRFASFALYDPLITGLSPPDTTTTGAVGASTTTMASAGGGATAAPTGRATTTAPVRGAATTAPTGGATTTALAGGATTTTAPSGLAATTTLGSGATTASPGGAATTTAPATTTAVVPATVEGSLDLSVGDCTAFRSQPNVTDGLSEGIASAAGGGISKSDVTVSIACSRRLRASRLLSGTTATVSYVIAVPPTSTSGGAAPAAPAAVADSIASETLTTFTAKITQALQTNGVPAAGVSVAVVSTPAVVLPPTTTSFAVEEPTGAGSRGSASPALAAVACLLAAAALA